MEIDFTETQKPTPGVIIPTAPTGPAPTAEQLEEQKKKAFAAMGWGEPPKETPPAPAPAAPVVEEPPVVVEEPAAPAPTSEDLIRRTVRETVTAMAPAAPAPVGFKMNDADAADYKVLLYLEQKQPGKWAGKAQLFLDYVKKHYAYMEKWQQDNAGQSYDPDANEHAAWYESNQPDIDPEELQSARIRMDAVAEARAEIAPDLNRIKAERAMQENAPTIRANVEQNILSMVDMVDPVLAKLVSDANGKPAMSKENALKLNTKDPIAAQVLNHIIQNEMAPLIHELELSVIPDLGIRLNPAVNQRHAAIDNFRQQAENELSSAPAEVRNQGGKEFCTLEQLQTMRDNIMASNKPDAEKNADITRLDKKYWTLNVDDLQAFIVKFYAEKAKKTIGELDSIAKAKYAPTIAGGEPTATPPAPTIAQPAVKPTPVSGKPNAPGGGASSDVVATGGQGNIPAKTFAETAAVNHFKR